MKTIVEFWTEAERAIVERVYPISGGKGVQALLPHRSRLAIKNAACRYDVARRSDKPRGSAKRPDFTGIPVHDYSEADKVAGAWRGPVDDERVLRLVA